MHINDLLSSQNLSLNRPDGLKHEIKLVQACELTERAEIKLLEQASFAKPTGGVSKFQGLREVVGTARTTCPKL